MKSLVVSERAIYSFKHDWGLEEGQHVRIYAKYAGEVQMLSQWV